MIVLDTNVASELMKSAPDQFVRKWLVSQQADRLHTTSITVAEIGYGIERLPVGRRRDLLRTAADELFSAFEVQILPFDAAAAAVYPAVVMQREQAGLPIDGFDAQIAAVCRVQEARLATRNVKDFVETGVDLVDPWHDR